MGKALVLGGGGIAGISWEAGLICGLLREGVDLTRADVIVGTSAGAVVGALLASGVDLETAIAAQAEAEAAAEPVAAAEPDLDEITRVFGILADTALEPGEARRQVGALSLASAAATDLDIEQIFMRLGVAAWPERPLKVTSVDALSGEFVVWEGHSGAPLPKAVAASCAVPCVFRPVEINGRPYMDGGVRSVTSADLAAGATGVVVLEPMASLTPREVLQAEIARLGDVAVASVGPDEAALAVFGTNILDPGLWLPAFKAGLAQAPGRAAEVAAAWS